MDERGAKRGRIVSKHNTMAAPKGNKNAVGNRGGGRKSAYQELSDAQQFRDLFFEEQDQEAIEAKIRAGRFSLKDRYALNGMEGDTRVLNKIVDKILPDGLDVKATVGLKISFDPTFNNAPPRQAEGDR
jgi:hypothetical protein